jgi:hypothetical protein
VGIVDPFVERIGHFPGADQTIAIDRATVAASHAWRGVQDREREFFCSDCHPGDYVFTFEDGRAPPPPPPQTTPPPPGAPPTPTPSGSAASGPPVGAPRRQAGVIIGSVKRTSAPSRPSSVPPLQAAKLNVAEGAFPWPSARWWHPAERRRNLCHGHVASGGDVRMMVWRRFPHDTTECIRSL